MKRQRMYRCKYCNTPIKGHMACRSCQQKSIVPDKDKVREVMHEFKEGTLVSGSGKKVTKRKQAIAIALSEARQKSKKRRK